MEQIIVDLILDIRYKETKIIKLEEKLEILINETGYQLHTIPGVHIATTAKLISEIDNIERLKNEEQLVRIVFAMMKHKTVWRQPEHSVKNDGKELDTHS